MWASGPTGPSGTGDQSLCDALQAVARCRRSGHRTIATGCAALAIGLLGCLVWPPADITRHNLHLLLVGTPLMFGACTLYVGLWVARAAARARLALDGPRRAVFLTGEIGVTPRGLRGLVVTLRRTVDQPHPDVDFKLGLYRTASTRVHTRSAATVFGTLAPDTVAVVVVSSDDAVIGRVRYSAFEVERLRALAASATSPEQREHNVQEARSVALTAKPASVPIRVYLWTLGTTAVLIPGAALAHHHHPAAAWSTSLIVFIVILLARRKYKAHRRAALPF
jgi:hypothetical protein